MYFKWVLRNNNRDAVSLETIMRFEGYDGWGYEGYKGVWGYEGYTGLEGFQGRFH